LRGSVSVALALSVPETLAERETIIAVVFGVMLFTLLVQGMTTKPLLETLNLLGDEPLRQKYLEAIARRVALNRVLDHLKAVANRREIEPDYYDYQSALVQGQLSSVRDEINDLQAKYPQFRELVTNQLREEMLAIESDTYAEFIRAGRLKESLSPMLEEVLVGGDRDES